MKIRLRKWGTAITVALAATGGGDPLTSALEYHEHMASSRDMAERSISITRDTGRGATRSSVAGGERSALPPLLLSIRAHESGGDYTAVSSTGCNGAPCGGAYQLHSWYASEWAARAGYPGMSSNAATWPPATQDAVALHLYYSTSTPGWHWCQFTTYC